MRVLAGVAGLPSGVIPSGEPDWVAWQRLAAAHKLDAYFGAHADHPLMVRHVPAEIRQMMRVAYARNAPLALNHLTSVQKVITSCVQHNFSYVMLKGSAIWPLCYRSASERIAWDIDLIAAPGEDAHAFAHTLRQEGFRGQQEGTSLHHHLKALRDPSTSVPVEIHTNLTTPPLSTMAIQAFWQRRRLDTLFPGGPMWVFDDIARLAHHALHALNDPMDSPLIRNLFETGLLAAHLPEEQTAEFRTFVERCGLARQVARALHVASDWFGTPPLLPRPRASAWEAWCRRSANSPRHGETGKERVWRQVGRGHILMMQRGVSLPLPLAAPLLLASEAFMFFAKKCSQHRPFLGKLQAVSAPHLEVGEGILIHHPQSGEVHLLNQDAAAVLNAFRTPASTRDLGHRLPNMASDQRQEALRTLFASGLITRKGH